MNEEYKASRRDYFAAHAMQGLLASGDFTQEYDDGLWVKLERVVDRQEGEPYQESPIAELSWLISDWMIEREEK